MANIGMEWLLPRVEVLRGSAVPLHIAHMRRMVYQQQQSFL